MPFLVGYVTPQDFGAVGDGVTDDTAAIQAALNAVNANGSSVFVPPASYKITSSLNITVTGTQIIGSGWGSQIIYDGNVVSPAIKATGNVRAVIRDLRISQTNVSHLGTALDMSQLNSSVADHLLIDASGSGVMPLNGIVLNASTCLDNTISNCRINYGGNASSGINISGSSNATTIQNTRLIPQSDNASSSGIYVTNSTSTLITKAHVESAAGFAVQLDTGAHATSIHRLVSIGNNVGLKVASGVVGTSLYGSSITTSGTANVQDSGTGTQILNAWPNSGTTSYNHINMLNTDAFNINGVPVPGNVYAPSDAGLIAWTYDIGIAPTNTSTTINGTVYLGQIVLRYPTTISNIVVDIATAATGVTANQNFLGLYDSSGVRQAVTAAGAIDAGLATTGALTGAVTPFAAPAGKYWIAFVFNATGAPQVARSTSFSAPNYNLTASTFRYATNGTSQTSLPASITPASNSTSNVIVYWGAVS